jgi:UDP-glucose 4-epimerase
VRCRRPKVVDIIEMVDRGQRTRFVVIGAGGFLGRSICEQLISHGSPVVAVGPNIEIGHSLVERVERRIRDAEDLSQILGPGDVVFDAAGLTVPAMLTSFSGEQTADELRLHAAIIDASIRRSVAKLIIISSGGTVYGEPDEERPLTESHPVAPISCYGVLKVQIEEMAKGAVRTGQLDAVICRLSNPYGPGQTNRRPQGLVAAVFERLSGRKSIQLWDGGVSVRDYIFIEDACCAVVGATRLAAGTIVNLSTGIGRSTLAVVRDAAALLGVEPKIELLNASISGLKYNVLSNDLLCTSTNWKPRFTWHEGLSRTAQWWGAVDRRTSRADAR